ncbi:MULTISPECIES: flavoprotein [unclassified Saccharopolyspora]|uniref:flavoprotein n=1 Tax=unclassified Saccharopolyspora TaxID=2646250 RepID=UPI001CD4ADE2|nr:MULTISPECIES: flavoprotein [unclassified Saccharopolyspora]MCA1189916.1 flavoprotein [Saccharopolyspora sp. 6T]MCA1195823.1 flavoprotein [Saccharopolyspora sp. 6V]MCA1229430.1 flavoprotein [Saccharopolyspora sp. 6M]MCA1283284.1 flavoprotein [Saccharopolyspora sp. 7B]
MSGTVLDDGRPVLYALAMGSPAARDVGRLVELAQADGWEVCVVTSPDGRRFLDVEALAAKTGHPVRSEYKDPAAADELPPADGMIAAPITCNSLAKWAAGISDTLPLGLLVEAVGKRQPVVAMPFSNRAQIAFPAVREAMRSLGGWGVEVLAGPDVYEQHEPGTGAAHLHRFPWELAWRTFLAHPWQPAR